MSKQRVMLGWPDGGSVRAEFTKALLDLQRFELTNPSDDYELVLLDHATSIYVQANRNVLVELAQRTGADWLLQLDGDESFQPTLLRQMMGTADREKRPIVVGLYVNLAETSESEGAFEVLDAIYAETETGEYRCVVPPANLMPFEVDAAGSGILLTHLSVFDRIGYPWFWLELIQPTGAKVPQVMNEDLAFCRRAREVGLPVWCDPRAEAIHYKTLALLPSTFRSFLTRARQVHSELRKLA